MIDVVESSRRGKTQLDWLESYHNFSFGSFYDPENIHFGPIRVLNDDIVQPDSGFPKHPHNNMEIVTIVLEGELTHEDSSGGRGTITAGEIQRMTAGKGIFHSEFNNLHDKATRLLQIWFFPDQQNLTPGYDQRKYDLKETENKLYKVVGNDKESGHIFINQDAELFISNLKKDAEVKHNIKETRGVYIYLADGNITINDKQLKKGDAAKISDESALSIKAEEDSYFVLFDVPLN